MASGPLACAEGGKGGDGDPSPDGGGDGGDGGDARAFSAGSGSSFDAGATGGAGGDGAGTGTGGNGGRASARVIGQAASSQGVTGDARATAGAPGSSLAGGVGNGGGIEDSGVLVTSDYGGPVIGSLNLNFASGTARFGNGSGTAGHAGLASNFVDGYSVGGTVELSQVVNAGSGAKGTTEDGSIPVDTPEGSGTGGDGGNASSNLILSFTRGETSASVSTAANAGQGGHSQLLRAGDGGAAFSSVTASATGRTAVSANATGKAGDGGTSGGTYNGTVAGTQGGTAGDAIVSAISTTTGGAATATAEGDGGKGGSGNGLGGIGGLADVTAEARIGQELNRLSTADATAHATARGGDGGNTHGGSLQSAGPGGSATAQAIAIASYGNAEAIAKARGGKAGRVDGGSGLSGTDGTESVSALARSGRTEVVGTIYTKNGYLIAEAIVMSSVKGDEPVYPGGPVGGIGRRAGLAAFGASMQVGVDAEGVGPGVGGFDFTLGRGETALISGDVHVLDGGSLDVAGGVLEAGRLDNDGLLRLGGGDVRAGEVDSDGTIVVDVDGRARLGGDLDLGGDLVVERGTLFVEGTLSLDAGARLSGVGELWAYDLDLGDAGLDALALAAPGTGGPDAGGLTLFYDLDANPELGGGTFFGPGGVLLAGGHFAASVPEPATAGLLGVGGLLLVRRRR